MTLWWLSYADEDGPRGVVVAEGSSFLVACVRARTLGVSPGGQVQGFEVPPEQLAALEPLEGTFLTVERAQQLGEAVAES